MKCPGREGDREKPEMAKCGQHATAQMHLLKCDVAGDLQTSSLKDSSSQTRFYLVALGFVSCCFSWLPRLSGIQR